MTQNTEKLSSDLSRCVRFALQLTTVSRSGGSTETFYFTKHSRELFSSK